MGGLDGEVNDWRFEFRVAVKEKREEKRYGGGGGGGGRVFVSSGAHSL